MLAEPLVEQERPHLHGSSPYEVRGRLPTQLCAAIAAGGPSDASVHITERACSISVEGVCRRPDMHIAATADAQVTAASARGLSAHRRPQTFAIPRRSCPPLSGRWLAARLHRAQSADLQLREEAAMSVSSRTGKDPERSCSSAARRTSGDASSRWRTRGGPSSCRSAATPSEPGGTGSPRGRRCGTSRSSAPEIDQVHMPELTRSNMSSQAGRHVPVR